MSTDSEIIVAPSDIYRLWQPSAEGQDNFSVFPVPDLCAADFYRSEGKADHGTPLLSRAIKFWLSLHPASLDESHTIASDSAADFKALTPELLAPIKPHSILLMHSPNGWIIRFMGTDLPAVFGPDLGAGVLLHESPPFAAQQSLQSALDHIQTQPRLCGLSQIDQAMKTDMLFVPLYKEDTDHHFILCIAGAGVMTAPAEDQTPEQTLDHHTSQADASPPLEEEPCASHGEEKEAETTQLAEKLADIQKNIGRFTGQNSASNQALYQTLAATLDFYQLAQENKLAYDTLLKSAQLKTQKRAPFTPMLKLVFGKDYDKTRLTEYAAALSYAWRQGCSGDEFTELIHNTPGGIKGCVQAERQERKKARGDFQASSLTQAIDALRKVPAHHSPIEDFPFKDFHNDEEFSLVIIRKNKNGSHDLIAPYQATPSVLETALRKTAKQINTVSDAGSPPTAAPSANSQQANQPNAGEKK